MSETARIQIVELMERGQTTVLRVSGRLEAGAFQPLLRRCAQVQSEGRNLVLDCSGISFLGSGGVGALLMIAEQFREQGGAVRFAAMSEPALSVVKQLNLESFLTLYATVEDAIGERAA